MYLFSVGVFFGERDNGRQKYKIHRKYSEKIQRKYTREVGLSTIHCVKVKYFSQFLRYDDFDQDKALREHITNNKGLDVVNGLLTR